MQQHTPPVLSCAHLLWWCLCRCCPAGDRQRDPRPPGIHLVWRHLERWVAGRQAGPCKHTGWQDWCCLCCFGVPGHAYRHASRLLALQGGRQLQFPAPQLLMHLPTGPRTHTARTPCHQAHDAIYAVSLVPHHQATSTPSGSVTRPTSRTTPSSTWPSTAWPAAASPSQPSSAAT